MCAQVLAEFPQGFLYELELAAICRCVLRAQSSAQSIRRTPVTSSIAAMMATATSSPSGWEAASALAESPLIIPGPIELDTIRTTVSAAQYPSQSAQRSG